MGSLMAGWDSPIHGFKPERNRSLTKEEIAAFWRLKKIEEEERFFLKTSYKLAKEDKKVVYDGSEPLPPSLIAEEERMEPLLKKHGWWISSNWAFLNEPPYISSKASYNYSAQFHVAQKHIDNFNLHPVTTGAIIA